MPKKSASPQPSRASSSGAQNRRDAINRVSTGKKHTKTGSLHRFARLDPRFRGDDKRREGDDKRRNGDDKRKGSNHSLPITCWALLTTFCLLGSGRSFDDQHRIANAVLARADEIEQDVKQANQHDITWLQHSLTPVWESLEKTEQQHARRQAASFLHNAKLQLQQTDKRIQRLKQSGHTFTRELRAGVNHLSRDGWILDDCLLLLHRLSEHDLFASRPLAIPSKWGDGYAATTLKIALLSMNLAVRHDDAQETFWHDAIAHMRLLFPCAVPVALHHSMHGVMLYRSAARTLYLPNGGFAFGADPTAWPNSRHNQGLDCAGFANAAARIPFAARPRHLTLTWQHQMGVNIHPLDQAKWRLEETRAMVTRLAQRYRAVHPRQARRGDVLVWMWPSSDNQTRHGHMMIITERAGDTVTVVEANRTGNGRSDGITRRTVSLVLVQQGEKPASTYVLRSR
ncbi:MAG: hypothetical protein AAF471_02745 [Myxococcota bacterium]